MSDTGTSQGERDAPNFTKPEEIITVRLLSSGTDYPIYKSVLLYCSDYFHAALDGVFAESTSKYLELSDFKDAEFGTFVRLVHLRSVDGQSGTSNTHFFLKSMSLLDLTQLWVLLDYLQCPDLLLMTMTAIKRLAAQDKYRIFPANVTKYIFDHTDTNSALRRFALSQLSLPSVSADELRISADNCLSTTSLRSWLSSRKLRIIA